MNNTRSLLIAVALAITGNTAAQQSVQPAAPAAAATTQRQDASPNAQAEIALQDQEISKAAGLVVALVDQQKTGEVWEGASLVAKQLVSKDSFVQQIALDRQKLGAVVSRRRVAVTRAVYPAGDAVPAGNYISVVVATKFANQPQEVRELISFHLDDDKTWRVAGYSLR